MYANKFCDAGQVPIFRYFEACSIISVIVQFRNKLEKFLRCCPKTFLSVTRKEINQPDEQLKC